MSHVDGVDDGIGYGVSGKSSKGHGVSGHRYRGAVLY